MFGWEYTNENNTACLNNDGTAVASISPDRIVILREMTIDELCRHFTNFKRDLYDTLYDVLAKTPAEFAYWHGGDKYKFTTDICPHRSCVAFKRYSVASNKLHWLYQPPVMKAFISHCLISPRTPHGRLRNNAIRGKGGSVEVALGLSLDEQRGLLRSLFDKHDLDVFIACLGQANIFALVELEEAISGAANEEDALSRIAILFSSFMLDQQARGHEGSAAKGMGRHFASPWFIAYLAREGLVLWPTDAAWISENVVPRMLKPMLWSFFAPERSRALARHLIGPEADPKLSAYFQNVYRDLLWTTNFFQYRSVGDNQLLHLKRIYDSPGCRKGQRAHGLNLLFKATLQFNDLDFEDFGTLASYFGGGRRGVSDHGYEAFSWVTAPKQHQLRRFRAIFDSPPPDNFPDYVLEWAVDLRTLIPLFDVKAIEQKINDLDFWLLYLISIGEKYAPRTWQEINREKHINSDGNAAYTTFTDFVRKLGHARSDSYVATVRQAWTLAASRDGFATRIACPIDPEFDFDTSGSTPGRPLRTRRKSIDEAILETLIQENRRADEKGKPFAFARGLGRYDRDVTNRKTGRRRKVFWPAVPIILDTIFNTGARIDSVLWQDSGEGDEFWVDPRSKTKRPNPLPSATRGRETGFLRLTPISDTDQILGMFLPISKMGPYSVPWVDEKSAKNYDYMRKWQIIYNPIKRPVKSTRKNIRKRYLHDEKITRIYPVFRDPRSKNRYPPTDVTIREYLTLLCRHCEPIFNKKRREAAEAAGKPFRWEPLLRPDGKSRWKPHEIRVAVITTLIEAGVPPNIVRLLVGHKTLAMTLYYVAIEDRRVHERLKAGMEERRRQAISDLANLKADDDIGKALQLIFGGLVTLRGDQFQGAELLKDALLSQEPGAYEVFAHGICPGGDCNTGGELYKNAFRPVFRPRACSRCRYRITGAKFLNGLVFRLNSLVLELISSAGKEIEMNRRIEIVEDGGQSTVVLEGLISRERELRDAIWDEWAAELTTIRKAEALDEEWADSPDNVPMLTGMNATEIRTKFESVHHLALLHQVLSDENIILGATIDIPPEARAKRDEMLLEIAQNNGAHRFFYALSPDKRRKALDGFGEVITSHAREMGDLGIRYIDALIDGSETSPRLSSAAKQLCASISADRSQPVVLER